MPAAIAPAIALPAGARPAEREARSISSVVAYDGGTTTIEAERSVSIATVQLARYDWAEPFDHQTEFSELRVDLCLTPRPQGARACFRRSWAHHRFEPIGELFLIPAGQLLHARGESGHQASISCNLRPERIRDWFDGGLDWRDDQLSQTLDIDEPKVRALLLRLAEEARSPGFASEMLVELVAGQIAIELARYRSHADDRSGAGGLAPWRLRLIDERLREVRAPPSLGELATLCNVSIRQLTRGFRASRGISIGDHVAHARIEGAKRLLAGGECVKAIAFSIGFASPSSFATAFRRATGFTPSDYRDTLPRA